MNPSRTDLEAQARGFAEVALTYVYFLGTSRAFEASTEPAVVPQGPSRHRDEPDFSYVQPTRGPARSLVRHEVCTL